MDFSKNRGKSAFRDGTSDSDGFGIAKGGMSKNRSGGKTKKKRGYSKKQDAKVEMKEQASNPRMERKEDIANKLAQQVQQGQQLIQAGQSMIQEAQMIAQQLSGGGNGGGDPRMGGNPNMGGDPRMGRGRMA